MDLRQLRYFVSIAASGSFSRAATDLNVAQPALSQHVANMESELGVQLLFRSTRGVTTTECGETLLAHAKTILQQVDNATRAMKNQADSPAGTVTVGLPSSASLALAVPLLVEAEQISPDITVKVLESHSGYMSDWVKTGFVDLAIVYNAVKKPGIDLQPLLSEELYLVRPHMDSLEKKSTVLFMELDGLPLVLTGREHGLRDLTEQYATDYGIALNIKTELDSLTAIKDVVATGFGNSILPWSAIRREYVQGTLSVQRIVGPAIIREVQLAVSNDWPPTQATIRIASLIRQLTANLVRADHWRGILLER